MNARIENPRGLLKGLFGCIVVGAALQAWAGFDLGDADNYAVLYEGNGANTFNFNNSHITGNVGIGITGKAQLNGPGTITGSINFSAANTGQYSDSGVTVTGGVNYNVADVTTALSDSITGLNKLSQTLGGESGTSTAITGGGSLSASSGTLDGAGNRVFTASVGSSFSSGTAFTINGGASDYVVLNVPTTGGHGFNGSIVLSGGITSDHVLINLCAGNYSTLTGGDTLTISTSGFATMGTFLDPNGDFQINNSILDGRLFGGDTHNVSVVSGAEIDAPVTPVPEPATFVAGALLLLPLGGSTLRILRRKVTV